MSVLEVVTERIGELKMMIDNRADYADRSSNIYDARKHRNEINRLSELLEVNETIYMLLRNFN